MLTNYRTLLVGSNLTQMRRRASALEVGVLGVQIVAHSVLSVENVGGLPIVKPNGKEEAGQAKWHLHNVII